MKRVVLHYDMDCFYAAVEIRDNPRLKGKSVIIGSKPPTRSVVSTCSYEARKYGVKSGQSCNKAIELCPNAVFIQPNIAKYKNEHYKIREIIEKYSDTIEYIGLDEGYMDITNIHHIFHGPEKLALQLKKEIFSKLRLTCSVGIGYNKLTAKISSEENKPNGFYAIKSEKLFQNLVCKKKVDIIPGIGKVSKKSLNKKGYYYVQDLYKLSLEEFKAKFGKKGIEIFYLIRGIDDRPVCRDYVQKSYGKELTLDEDINDKNIIFEIWQNFTEKLSFELKEEKKYCRTITVKIKYSDFEVMTRSKTLIKPSNNYRILIEEVATILKNIALTRSVRLVGVYFSNICDRFIYQQSLFENKNLEKVEKLKYSLKKRYGLGIILEEKKSNFDIGIERN